MNFLTRSQTTRLIDISCTITVYALSQKNSSKKTHKNIWNNSENNQFFEGNTIHTHKTYQGRGNLIINEQHAL